MKTTKMLMIAALGAVLASCGSKSGGGKPNFADNEYAVRTVEAQGTELQTTYPATIKGIQDVQIRPKVSGFITKVCVQEGQTVGVGQLLCIRPFIAFISRPTACKKRYYIKTPISF